KNRSSLLDWDGAWVFLVRDHEHQDFCALVRAWIPGCRVYCGRRLVERVARFERPGRLAIERKFVRALDDVPEGMGPLRSMLSAAGAGLSIEKAYSYFAPRHVRERLREQLTGSCRRGLGFRLRDERRRAPCCHR